MIESQTHEQVDKVEKIEQLLSEGGSLKEIDDETWLWMHTEGYKTSSIIQNAVPLLPSGNTQFGFNGRTNAVKNLTHGFKIYQLVKKYAENNIGPIDSLQGILDFGCGWGRILRFFRRDIAYDKLWGIDVNSKAIVTCQATMPEINFRHIDFDPPSGLVKNSFNVVFANSVFSHLGEEAHMKWINEFESILKPGGIVVLTTWDRDFVLRCQKARDGELKYRSPKRLERLSEIFVDTDKALQVYDSGEFCYEGGLPQQHKGFGNACISKQYILNKWSKKWSLVDFIDDQSQYPQAVIIAQLQN